jgi:hypothetical protein
MPNAVEEKKTAVEPGRACRLWVGMLLPPVAWLVQLQSLWLTSELGCHTSDFLWNHVVSVSALTISAIGGLIAYFEYRRWAPAGENASGDPRSRRRFMAMIGVLTGALFTTIIFAQWLPTLLGVPCEK